MAAMLFLCLVLYVGAFPGGVTSKVLSLGPITVIGGMCYTIYLFHYQIFSLLVRTTSNPYLFYAIGILSMLAFCTLFFVLIERPCVKPRWPKLLLAKVRSRHIVLEQKCAIRRLHTFIPGT